MNQVPVKRYKQLDDCEMLESPDGEWVELSALREVVEGLKYIEAVLCERKLCGHFTAEEIRQEAQRLLASLGEVGK